MGRDFGGQRWGPRPLDLDIIFYDQLQMQTERLEIPHPRWAERDFVKAPVADLYSTVELDPSATPCAAPLSVLLGRWRAAGGAQPERARCVWLSAGCSRAAAEPGLA